MEHYVPRKQCEPLGLHLILSLSFCSILTVNVTESTPVTPFPVGCTIALWVAT